MDAFLSDVTEHDFVGLWLNGELIIRLISSDQDSGIVSAAEEVVTSGP